MRPSSSSNTIRPERSGFLNWNSSSRLSRGSRSIRSIFASFFMRSCACRAFVAFARKRSTNASMRAISACCFSIARPSASSRAACSLRQAVHVPLK